jgi:hypothetical protein
VIVVSRHDISAILVVAARGSCVRVLESKIEAQAEATRIRAAILAGTFRTEPTSVTESNVLVLDQLGGLYFAKYVSRRPVLR